MGTSYRLTIAFVGVTLTSLAMAVPVTEQAAQLDLTSEALVLTSGQFACPVGMKDATLTKAGTPDWLSGVGLHEWVEINGTSWTAGLPSVDKDAIDAWGTLPLIAGTGTLVSPANGGHGDSFDNGVYSIDLLADSPSWETQISASTSAQIDVSHYADGKPSSRHGYHFAHYIAQRDRMMLFGGRGFYGNGYDGLLVDGHSVTGTWTWDAANTWPALAPGQGWGSAHDPTTGNVMTHAGRLWTQATNSWDWVSAYTGGWRYPVVHDPVRSQFFALQWGDGGPDSLSTGMFAQKFNVDTGAGTTITFDAGSAAAVAQFEADEPFYAGMDYDPENDRFLFYRGQGTQAGRVYVITPNATSVWSMSIQTLTGTAPGPTPSSGAGMNGRFRYVAALKCFVVMPQASSNFFAFKVA